MLFFYMITLEILRIDNDSINSLIIKSIGQSVHISVKLYFCQTGGFLYQLWDRTLHLLTFNPRFASFLNILESSVKKKDRANNNTCDITDGLIQHLQNSIFYCLSRSRLTLCFLL